MDAECSHNTCGIEVAFLRDSMDKVFGAALPKVNGLIIPIKLVGLVLPNLDVEAGSCRRVRPSVTQR